MTDHKKYMNLCIELARKGLGKVAPNPMVGCVIVCNNTIIGQGYHVNYGEAHAEVNAIESVEDKSLLNECTLYVNLEPCAHFGKTPPCADLILKHNIPRVVVGCKDSYAEVAGKGIEKLKQAGIDVTVGVLERKALDLNKRFFTFHNKNRPYIILKWAQTKDGFIDVDRSEKELKDNWITTQDSKRLVHQWRSEEAAILVGTNTALNDDPELTVREVDGPNPLRIVIDNNLRLPSSLKLFDGSVETIVFNTIRNAREHNVEYVKIESLDNNLEEILGVLHKRNIQSLIVEGGAKVLQSFIDAGVWDEARVFEGDKKFEKGLAAPIMNRAANSMLQYSTDTLSTYVND